MPKFTKENCIKEVVKHERLEKNYRSKGDVNMASYCAERVVEWRSHAKWFDNKTNN